MEILRIYSRVKCSHQSDQPIDIAVLLLPEAVHSEDALYVVRRVPRRVQDDDAVRRRHVEAEGTGARRDQEQSAGEWRG